MAERSEQQLLAELAARDTKMRLTRRSFLRRAGVAAAVVGAPGVWDALAGATSEALAGTKLSGTIVFAGFSGEDGPKVAAPFLKKNHLLLKSSYVAGNDDMLTKLQTGGTSTIDVLTLNKDYSAAELAAGFVRPLDLEQIPNAQKLFPAFKDAPWTHVNGKVYGVPLIWGDEPCVYNPKKWRSLPPSYTDFADPKFRGEMTTLDDPYSNIWLFSKSLGHPDPAKITQKQLNAVLQALIAFKKNLVTLAESFGDMTDVLVRGDASIAINAWAAMEVMAAADHVKLVSGVPSKDGTYYWSDAYYITKNAPNLAASYAYINYMSSPQANAQLATQLSSACTNSQALAHMPSSIARLYDFHTVQRSSLTGPLSLGILPPLNPTGGIVGVQAWQAAWEQFKLA